MYTPESAALSAEICRVPLLTFIRSSTQAPWDRFQEIVGKGSPIAEQLKVKSLPSNLLTVGGGLVMNFGSDNTTNEVTADVSPRAFFA